MGSPYLGKLTLSQVPHCNIPTSLMESAVVNFQTQLDATDIPYKVGELSHYVDNIYMVGAEVYVELWITDTDKGKLLKKCLDFGAVNLYPVGAYVIVNGEISDFVLEGVAIMTDSKVKN